MLTRKINALKANLVVTVKQTTLRAKFIASLVGNMISMSLALGPVAKFTTRALYSVLETRSVWCEFLSVPNEAKGL